MGQFGIGQKVRRIEDSRLLTGNGRFTADINLEGQAYAIVVRSPHAHARINSVNTRAAGAAPGVLAVYTSADVTAAGLGTIPCVFPVEQRDGSPMVAPPHPLLAVDTVRHIGDPVAFVIAESLEEGRDAAELIDIDYEPLPAVVDTEHAVDPGAPHVWDAASNNICFVWERGDRQATETAFKQAAHVVKLRLVNNRIVVNPLEPRAAVGDWDGYRFTLYTPTQGPHLIRQQLASDIFKLPTEKFRVVTPDVGGAFGIKTFLYPEQALVLYAARALKRPVKWVAERSADGFQADAQGRDQVHHAELALDGDGRFLGLRVRSFGNLGAYLSTYGPGNSTVFGAGVLPGVYRLPAVHIEVTGVFTNTVPVDAYRGTGRAEMAYLAERLVDVAARQLGLDTTEIRRRNLIPPEAIPFTNCLDLTYDSGDFARILDKALRRAHWTGFHERKSAARVNGKLRGIGLAFYVAMAGGPDQTASVRMHPDGSVVVLIGTQSSGQGHETAYAQIVADVLEIDISRVRVVQGDTERISTGNATGGSHSLFVGGAACQRAAEAVIEKAQPVAAELLETAVADVRFARAGFEVPGTDLRVELSAVAAAMLDPNEFNEGRDPGLCADFTFNPEAQTFANGCHICEVEIDRETGQTKIVQYTAVDDFGTVVNPLLLAGQIHGGIAQGIGQALLEDCVYEKRDGQLLSGSLLDYCLPRADDLPFIDFELEEGAPCTTNPFGIKGAGEAGAIGAPPAVVNAVADGLSEFGVTHIDMPATGEKVWRAIHGKA